MMRYTAALFLACLLLWAMPPAYGQASSKIVLGKVKYKVDRNNNDAYVIGYEDGLTEATIAARVTDGESKEHPVVGIVSEAFQGCKSLRKLEVPASVKSIDNRAFSGCEQLAEVTLSEGLTTIGEDAFHHCAMSTISIPATVTGIGTNPRRPGQYSNPFGFCQHLATIALATGNTKFFLDGQGGLYTIDKKSLIAVPGALSGTYTTLPELEEVHAYALAGCTQLTAVELTNKVNTFYRHAFDMCSGLKRIKLPESLEYFNGGEVFYNCSSLEAIEVDSKNEHFVSRDGVLYGEAPAYGAGMGQALCCYPAGKKGAYQIPEDVKRIEDCAFKGCRELTDITLPEHLQAIGMHAFYGCEQLEEVALPSSLTECQGSVFAGCVRLRKATFKTGANPLDIYGSIFENCVLLAEVELPANLEKIPEAMFVGCTSLQEITIPATVATLEPRAFKNCKKLQKIMCLAAAAPELQQAFFAVPPDKPGYKEHFLDIAADAILYVPEGSVEAYEASDWKGWFDGRIKAMTSMPHTVTVVPAVHGQIAVDMPTAEPGATVKVTVTPDPHFALDKLTVKDELDQELTLTTVADNVYTFAMGDKNVSVTAQFKSTLIPITSIELQPSTLTLTLGDLPVQLKATVVPAEATNQQLTWSSDNDNVATVDAVGMVTAMAEGRTTIWATAQDGSLVKAKCLVTVTKKNQPLAVESTLLAGVTAYPLPVHNELHIGQATNVTRIVVYDLLGNIRMEQAGNGQLVQTLYLAQLPKGIYLVQLLAADGHRTLRVAKVE